MRKNLIFGSLLAGFLMLLLPAVSAAEANVVQVAKKSPSLLKAQETYMEIIRAKYTNDPNPQTIIITLVIMLLKLIRASMLFMDAVILFIIFKIIGGGQNTTLIC